MVSLADMMNNMQQAAPMMQQIATIFQTQLQLLAAIAKNTSPASGYDVKSGLTTDKPADNRVTFSVASRSIDVTVEGNDAICQFSYDGVQFEKEFYLKNGVVSSFPMSCRGIQIRSRNTGAPATFQVVVFA